MAAPRISYNPSYKARATDFTGYQDLNYTAKAIGMKMNAQAFLVPIGSVHQFAGSVAPDGYFICDGSELSRNLYTQLFSVIGTTYGVGDGSTTFNLPNLKGNVAVGYDATKTYANTLGQTGGEKEHVLTVSEMPSHNHTGTTDSAGLHNHGITDPGHTHSYFNQPNSVSIINGLDAGADNANVGQTTGSSTTGITINNAGTHVHTFTTNNTGGDQPHNNLQPYLVMNYIIKYA